MKLRTLAITAITCFLPLMASAQGIPIDSNIDTTFTLEQKIAINKMISAWFEEHPEMLLMALQNAQHKANDALLDADDLIIGNGKDVTLTAFIDRSDKASQVLISMLFALAGSDNNLRIDIKELPLVSDNSVKISTMAYAARKTGEAQGFKFETLLLSQPEKIPTEAEVATFLNVDLAKFQAFENSPEAVAYLKRVRDMSNNIGITGIPVVLIGKRAFKGLPKIEELRQAILDAQK
jgi:protein-disulfide isomerase